MVDAKERTEMREIYVGIYFAEDNIIFAHQFGQFAELAAEPNNELASPQTWKENLNLAADYVSTLSELGRVAAVGLAVPGSFRIHLNPSAPKYGFLGNNPGPKRWVGFNVRDELLIRLSSRGLKNAPDVRIISQVGATSFGDFVVRYPQFFRKEDPDLLGRAKSRNRLYLVADAGIGASLIYRGQLFRGEAVPTIGHTIVHVRPESLVNGKLPYPCPYHPNRPCLNSVASLDAIKARWDIDAEDVPISNNEEMIEDVAFYLAQALTTHAFLLAPEQIIVGGRIARNPRLIPALRNHFRAQVEEWSDEVEPSYSQLHDVGKLFMQLSTQHAGVIGALKLAAGYEDQTAFAGGEV